MVWVNLDLKHGWLDLSIAKALSDHGRVDVADTDVTDETLSHELFHSMVSLLVRHSVVNDHLGSAAGDGWVVVNPLSWVFILNWHELQSNWEVDEVQVKVVDSEICQGLADGVLDVLWAMVGVP